MHCISCMDTYSQVSMVIKKNLRMITDVNNEGLYKLLDAPFGADEQALNKGYKKQALKFHPDKGGSAEQIQLIHHAREVLTGPLRALYDACGEEGLELKKQAEPQVRHLMRRDQICFVLFKNIRSTSEALIISM